MIEQFKRTLTASCGVGQGDNILVCCSGGIDSMVLLRLMLGVQAELDLKLHVVTVDHGLRCEAPGDAAFVLETCRNLGVEASLYELGMDPATPNLEEQARLRRYEAIYACRDKLDLRFMATGHTLDDQAETVLYRLARGTGLKGMQAMAYARPDGLIRPMLDITRAQIEAYARSQSIRYVTDQTNTDLTLTRNLIRQKIMPLLRRINPGATQALGRFAQIAREEHDLIEDQALALMDEALLMDWRICRVFDAPRLMAAPTAVLKCLAMHLVAGMLSEPRGIEAHQAQAVMDVLQGRVRAHTLKRRVRVERCNDYCTFSLAWHGPFYEIHVPGPGEYQLASIGQVVRIETSNCNRNAPLLIRSSMPGDTMAGKKVARLMADKRVIEPLRRFWPVLLSQGEVIGVAGIQDSRAQAELTFPL
jgi:tRNA(Ile)-lysidine synthase